MRCTCGLARARAPLRMTRAPPPPAPAARGTCRTTSSITALCVAPTTARAIASSPAAASAARTALMSNVENGSITAATSAACVAGGSSASGGGGSGAPRRIAVHAVGAAAGSSRSASYAAADSLLIGGGGGGGGAHYADGAQTRGVVFGNQSAHQNGRLNRCSCVSRNPSFHPPPLTVCVRARARARARAMATTMPKTLTRATLGPLLAARRDYWACAKTDGVRYRLEVDLERGLLRCMPRGGVWTAHAAVDADFLCRARACAAAAAGAPLLLLDAEMLPLASGDSAAPRVGVLFDVPEHGASFAARVGVMEALVGPVTPTLTLRSKLFVRLDRAYLPLACAGGDPCDGLVFTPEAPAAADVWKWKPCAALTVDLLVGGADGLQLYAAKGEHCGAGAREAARLQPGAVYECGWVAGGGGGGGGGRWVPRFQRPDKGGVPNSAATVAATRAAIAADIPAAAFVAAYPWGWEVPPLAPAAAPRSLLVVPYRDRASHAAAWAPAVLPSLDPARDRVLFVEQTPGAKFNRGALCNVGAALGIAGGFSWLVFHDVDLVPGRDVRAWYVRHPVASGSRLPPDLVHLAAPWKRYARGGGAGGGGAFLGGIMACTPAAFVAAGGFSNVYAGWGGEDDDLAERFAAAGIVRAPGEPSSVASRRNYVLDLELLEVRAAARSRVPPARTRAPPPPPPPQTPRAKLDTLTPEMKCSRKRELRSGTAARAAAGEGIGTISSVATVVAAPAVEATYGPLLRRVTVRVDTPA